MMSSIDNLNAADRALHSLAQLIALTGTNCLATQSDDSQANLDWNTSQQRLEGRPFEVRGKPLRLVIDLPTFNVQFLNENDQIEVMIAAQHKTPTDAINWWHTVMQDWGIKPVKSLNYRLEEAPVPLTTTYNRPASLVDWMHWRTTAHRALMTLNTLSGRASDIRIWPHHFDTGVYYAIPDETGNERAAIWAGFAIADTVSVEPYFYLSGYARQQPIDFSGAKGLTRGRWLILPDWQGAYLPVSMATDLEWITRFFEESYAWVDSQVS